MPAGSGSSTARGYGARHRRLAAVVLERDGRVCHWCGAPADQADHVLPRARGGATTLANLVASCGPCNARRGAQLGQVLRRRARLRPSRAWTGYVDRGEANGVGGG